MGSVGEPQREPMAPAQSIHSGNAALLLTFADRQQQQQQQQQKNGTTTTTTTTPPYEHQTKTNGDGGIQRKGKHVTWFKPHEVVEWNIPLQLDILVFDTACQLDPSLKIKYSVDDHTISDDADADADDDDDDIKNKHEPTGKVDDDIKLQTLLNMDLSGLYDLFACIKKKQQPFGMIVMGGAINGYNSTFPGPVSLDLLFPTKSFYTENHKAAYAGKTSVDPRLIEENVIFFTGAYAESIPFKYKIHREKIAIRYARYNMSTLMPKMMATSDERDHITSPKNNNNNNNTTSSGQSSLSMRTSHHMPLKHAETYINGTLYEIHDVPSPMYEIFMKIGNHFLTTDVDNISSKTSTTSSLTTSTTTSINPNPLLEDYREVKNLYLSNDVIQIGATREPTSLSEFLQNNTTSIQETVFFNQTNNINSNKRNVITMQLKKEVCVSARKSVFDYANSYQYVDFDLLNHFDKDCPYDARISNDTLTEIGARFKQQKTPQCKEYAVRFTLNLKCIKVSLERLNEMRLEQDLLL